MTFVAAIDACMCVDGAAPVTGGCRPCPAGEVAVNGACGCPAGQTHDAAGACVPAVGLGAPCDQTRPCSDATYHYCALRGADTAGTCTTTCASNGDCDAAYTCATWEQQPYCRTFDGFGAPCTSSTDCVGDATFCDTFVSHRCDVAGCSLERDDCPRGTQCCDFSAYHLGTLCAETCL